MPWRLLADYSGFFTTILGAVVGASVAWGGTRQMLKQLQEDSNKHSILLDNHSSDIKTIQLFQKDMVSRVDCEREQQQCHRYLCRKIDELIEHTKELQSRSESNCITMGQIKEQIKAIEKRMDYENTRYRNSG